MANIMSEERAREIETQLKEGRFNFAINCLHKVMKVNPDKNFVFSPPSIYEGLFLTSILIIGEMATRLENILSLNGISKADLINYCICKKESTKKLVVYPKYLLWSHNIMWWMKYGTNDLKLDSVLSHFIHTITRLDTKKDSDFEADYVNNVINTAMKIRNEMGFHHPVGLSQCEQVNDILLITYICCKFHYLPLKNVVPIRNYARISLYHEKLSMHVSDISFHHGDMSLFVFSPASFHGKSSDKWRIKENISSDDLFELTERLSTSDGIDELRNLLKNSRTEFSKALTSVSEFLPFEMERNLTIKDLLKALDIEELMETENFYLDFCENQQDQPSLCFGNVVHRSRVKVTDKMMVASAMTMILTGKESSPHSEVISVNRNSQFVWLIYDRLQEEIFCVGSFNNGACLDSQIVPTDMYQPGSSGVPPTKKRRIA